MGTIFFYRVCLVWARLDLKCLLCWLTWSLLRLHFVQNRPSDSAIRSTLFVLLCRLLFEHRNVWDYIKKVLGCNRIDLIDEDDWRLILLCQLEDVSDHSGTLAQILLYEFWTDDSDECGSGVISNGFCHHGLSCTWRSVHKNSLGWIDTDLSVKFGVSKRQLNGFSHLLFLDIKTTDIRESNIGFLLDLHHLNGGIGLWWQNIDDGMTVSVHGDTGWWLEFFPVKSGQNSNVVVCSACGSDQTVVFVDHFDEMSDDQRYGLDSLQFFLGSELLSLELDLIVLDVVFLDCEEL